MNKCMKRTSDIELHKDYTRCKCINIYRKNEKYLENYEKAKGIDFWLGLKSSKKYSPEQWVLFINNPNEFCK